MKKLIFLVLIVVLILALVPIGMAQAKKPAPSLKCTTEYDFVGDLGIVVDGRLLAWEGPITQRQVSNQASDDQGLLGNHPQWKYPSTLSNVKRGFGMAASQVMGTGVLQWPSCEASNPR